MPQPTDTSTHVVPARYLTEGIDGTGGTLKERPDDFMVEELPLYQPAGEGEHLYLMVEKRGLTAMQMIGIIARHFDVPRRAIGYAGLKDKQAITRQVISVHLPGKKPEDIPMLQHPRIAVLWADLHTNKLRRGHLAGNRFSIRVRNVKPTDARTALRVLRELEAKGLPDRVGEQRFGFLANNHLIGRALYKRDLQSAADLLLSPSPRSPAAQAEARDLYAAGDLEQAHAVTPRHLTTERTVLAALAKGATPEQAFAKVDRGVLGYYYSAFQSAVFNAVLDRRVEDGTLATLQPGDIAMHHESRNTFAVDDDTIVKPETAERLAMLEISPTGPMWGTSMPRASGKTDEAEVEALAAVGMSPADFENAPPLDAEMTGGTRRPLRVPVRSIDVEGGVDDHGPYIRCAFDLPRGAFATAVMAEIMKPDRDNTQHTETTTDD